MLLVTSNSLIIMCAITIASLFTMQFLSLNLACLLEIAILLTLYISLNYLYSA